MFLKILQFISAGLGLGYLPGAPGTFGTVLGSTLFYALRLQPHMWMIQFTAVFCVFAILISHFAEKSFGQKDCQKIVIDEVAGVLVAYLFVPFSVYHLVLGFILFRLFDIAKIWPANLAQNKLKGGLGIVGDDIVAGAQAGVLMYYLPTIIFWVKHLVQGL